MPEPNIEIFGSNTGLRDVCALYAYKHRAITLSVLMFEVRVQAFWAKLAAQAASECRTPPGVPDIQARKAAI
jgi:hypothetical protein